MQTGAGILNLPMIPREAVAITVDSSVSLGYHVVKDITVSVVT